MIGAVFMFVLAFVSMFAGLFVAEETDVMLGFFALGNTFAVMARLEMIERNIKEVAK